jgi:hypothetical protein
MINLFVLRINVCAIKDVYSNTFLAMIKRFVPKILVTLMMVVFIALLIAMMMMLVPMTTVIPIEDAGMIKLSAILDQVVSQILVILKLVAKPLL